MKLDLKQIPREGKISSDEFKKKYVKPQKPVVLSGLTEDWPAHGKWNLDYIDKKAGDRTVPLYDDRPVKHSDGFNEPHAEMKMSKYIDLLKREPTNYRIFLYNILKEVPELQDDIRYPDIGLKLIKSLPMMFFGGENSKVFMHYDIDFTNILHFHFHGRKRCILFPPDQSKYLYKIPYSLISREDIDFENPDLNKWPALKQAKGYVTEIGHGETLYMPEGYWHYMHYLTPGFSISLRSYPRTLRNLTHAAYNIVFMRHFDTLMRKWKGQKWIDRKNKKAIDHTHKNLGIKG